MREYFNSLTEEELDEFIMIRYNGITDEGDDYVATVSINKILKKKNSFEIIAKMSLDCD